MIGFGFKRLRLGELFGIPVFLDWSTIFLALMFLQVGDLIVALGMAVVLLASIVLHELGHSLTARCFGCETRDITLSVIGGCASLERMPRKSWQEFLVAAAGPAVSFVLGVLFFVLSVFMPEDGRMEFILFCGGHMNVALGLFNLLPGFPMDGGRIFRSVMRLMFTREKATYVAMIVGRVVAGLLVLGPLLGVTHIGPIPINGSFLLRLLIAWMIWQEGYREYLMARMESSWDYQDYRAHVSPPPYGGEDDDCDVTRDR
ncbi:MAG: M50 family metallopeptidase [Kiritimatiellae bacterium]|nr:M50 family metallopeptidase [Kiritimatiellia bacterium]